VTAWFIIDVEGAEKVLRAFVTGFLLGRRDRGTVLYGSDCDIAEASLRERIRDLLAGGTHNALFAPRGLAGELRQALLEGGAGTALGVLAFAEVTRARSSFAVEAYAEDVAARVKTELLAELPPGVTLEGLVETEEREPDHRGTVLYAPVHGYTYRVHGTFTGPLPGVVEMARRARDLEFARVRPLDLETATVPDD